MNGLNIRASKVTFIEALTDSISASWLAWNKHTHTHTHIHKLF